MVKLEMTGYFEKKELKLDYLVKIKLNLNGHWRLVI